uniref:Beta selinene synthase n=1 Tax=Zea mays subsp. mays TaxID=381124 RepID=A0A291LSC8_MAIZE|nr:beta selinene synthase [Zea mays subsp. mays]
MDGDIAAALPPVNQQSKADGTAVAAAAAAAACHGAFEPSVWGDFFVTYTSPPSLSQEPEEQMRERANFLKGEVRKKFEAAAAMSAINSAMLVDAVVHLGIDHCFREEIATALRSVHKEEGEFGSCDDLHTVAVRFLVLRQHGLWVSADVFDKFRDDTGSLSKSLLCSNPRGLLSLYNAAHMVTPEEKVLDDAIAFARSHLEAMIGELRSPMVEQVSRSLDIPLPRFSRRLESMHYIAEYGQEEGHDAQILELARLEFELVRSLHLRELREICRWWRELYNDVKLPYARDRIVEIYFWACGVIHEEEMSRARMIFAKTFAFTSLIDDTCDVHATLEEVQKFNEAMQSWEEDAVSIVPEYLRTLYSRTIKGFQEFEDMLEPNEKYSMSYVKKAYKLLLQYYLKEATWANENHTPSFKEHVQVSIISSGLPMLVPVLLMGTGLATREAFEWADSAPDMVLASGEVGRFLNDMASYKLGKNKKDVANAHECYMKEYGATGEEAFAFIANMTENAWRKINQACMEMDPAMLPAFKVAVVDLSRSMEIIYLGGKRDAYTFGSNLKDLVTSLFLKPCA